MKKIMVGVCAAAALLVSAGAQAEAVVIGYDIVHGLKPQSVNSSGNGNWTSFYTGTVKGGSLPYTYTGGSGTLNDGLVPSNGTVGNMLFNVSYVPPKGGSTLYSPVITLHLSEVTAIDNINFFTSVFRGAPNGAMTGATITIGGVSQALSSTGWGDVCITETHLLCNDRFSLAGTTLAGLPTDTIVFSDFTSSYASGFAIAEITVDGSVPITPSVPTIPAVPEPHTYAMLLAGLGLTGWAARRRKRA